MTSQPGLCRFGPNTHTENRDFKFTVTHQKKNCFNFTQKYSTGKKWTFNGLCYFILEAVYLKKELNKGKERVEEEQSVNALLKIKLTMGQEKNNIVKELKIELDQQDEPSLEKELCKERERCKKLVAYQQRFKVELLKCAELISHPVEFKRSVIDLKIKFTDDDDFMVLKRTEHERKFINGLQNKYKKVIDIKSREVLVERRRLCKKCLEVSHNTQELNEKTVLIRKLQEQIKETKQDGMTHRKQEQIKETHGPDPKLPKAPLAKVKGWFTRKGAARNKVYPSASKETTTSKPTRLDEDDTPSAPFCPDSPATSKEPCRGIVIHVIPAVKSNRPMTH